ncbi:MAG TPA: hypothetical protein DCY93_02040 [Firmicutes bacterium]|nr:hypothetical protein [Bacillota bacterium]
MYDISKYTPNAQKYLRLSWAAWEAGSKGNKEEYERILIERGKFCNENFTLEDFDSMIEDSSDYTPECLAWQRAKERYIAERQQKEIKIAKAEDTKVSPKQFRKAM